MMNKLSKREMQRIIREIVPSLNPEMCAEIYALAKYIKIPERDFKEGKHVFDAVYEVIKALNELKLAKERFR